MNIDKAKKKRFPLASPKVELKVKLQGKTIFG